jgi:hypothetical protein
VRSNRSTAVLSICRLSVWERQKGEKEKLATEIERVALLSGIVFAACTG